MFPVRFVTLYTDAVVWLLLALIVWYAWHVLGREELQSAWKKVGAKRSSVLCAGILSVFFAISLADSLHFRLALLATEHAVQAYAPQTLSLLDYLVGKRIVGRERSYSAPFAMHDFDRTSVRVGGKTQRVFVRLKSAAAGIAPEDRVSVIAQGFFKGTALGGIACALLLAVLTLLGSVCRRTGLRKMFLGMISRENPWRPVLGVWLVSFLIAGWLASIWPTWHILGTDAVGNDVLYSALKSVRTAVVIGTLATLCMLPLAIGFGIVAGYFRGWVDDVIQYIYTTITSIPSVLLIAASVLMIQVFIDKNPSLYETGLERADLRLFLLSSIIGVTSWSGLARLLRAETMKLSEMDFITAARAFGVSKLRIMMRHVFPNVAHIVLIVAVLDFSGIVLYEAVLSYVGVGVDPTMSSFGSMINSAASEMSRTPIVWWNLGASFVFMVLLVLSANLFASGVREAFDPRSRQGESDD